MERGYVKLWRKTLDSGLLMNPHALQVFCFLLLEATHEPHTVFIEGAIAHLEAGDVATSRKKIACALRLSERNVRTALSTLEKLKISTIKSTNKYSIISIVNWGTYQCNRPAERPAERQSADQQATSRGDCINLNTRMEELKNININNNSAHQNEHLAKRQEFTPPTVDEVRAYVIATQAGINPADFVAYYEERGWKVGNRPMVSWKRAVSTWKRRNSTVAVPHDPVASAVSSPQDSDDVLKQIDAIHRDYDDIIAGFKQAGRWDLAGKYEDQVWDLISETRRGIPYTPFNEGSANGTHV